MNEIAVVDCDMQSNVMLTNDANFNKFSNGSKYTYYGGFYKHFPAQIMPPKAGYWYITIDLGVGYEGKYNYLIKIETIEASGWTTHSPKPSPRRDGNQSHGSTDFFEFFG